MLKITIDSLTWPCTGRYIAVPIWQKWTWKG